ncbi:MAG: phage holin family protein [Candidatus Yonathbacteria bacterium]|nr:phage holin family protein [Candidatus Yonathbacteria bacterium]
MHLLMKWLLNALALLLAAYLVPGIHVDGLYVALIAALLLSVLNIIVKPILIILTLPINILTLGLFTFVINGLLFWFLGTFVKGFHVDGFFAAVVGALVVSIVSSLGGKLLNH